MYIHIYLLIIIISDRFLIFTKQKNVKKNLQYGLRLSLDTNYYLFFL